MVDHHQVNKRRESSPPARTDYRKLNPQRNFYVFRRWLHQHGAKGFESNVLRKPGFRLVEISLSRQPLRGARIEDSPNTKRLLRAMRELPSGSWKEYARSRPNGENDIKKHFSMYSLTAKPPGVNNKGENRNATDFGRMTSDEAPQSLKDFVFRNKNRRNQFINILVSVGDTLLAARKTSDTKEIRQCERQ